MDSMLIYIARDEAFNFIYRETIDVLAGQGEVHFFSPLHNETVPVDAHLVYLPGGYPEFFTDQLAQSHATMESLRLTKARIWAECGGMMYLSQGIDDKDMTGLLPFRTTMQGARLHLGYRQMTFTDPATGQTVALRGHEFHYSSIMGTPPPSSAQLFDAKGNPVDTGFYIYDNVYAGYTHWVHPLCPSEEDGHSPSKGLSLPHPSHSPAEDGKPAPALAPLMLAGTGSDVGKSILATALCRIFLQDGYHPAPFKAQNMALNSAATADGYEIGRAQMVQAEAARVVATTDMNPLLLKPNSEHTTQVVLNGKPIGNRNAYDYFRKEGREQLRKEVNSAFDRLARQYNPIVMEGAGSVCELNLMETDLVNMPMARHAQAKVVLVCDIDRGGVFAQAYGSIMLQKPEDRRRIVGIIVNKFRGDIRLFEEGRKMLEDICHVPVLGVVPYLKGVRIEAEDSMDLKQAQIQPPHPPRGSKDAGSKDAKSSEQPSYSPSGAGGAVQIAVILLRHISNFTDFDRLQSDPRVNLFYARTPGELKSADIIILPGTKSTLADLYELQENGMKEAILRAHREGKRIVGICGGYQMMGQSVEDPDGVEGSIARLPGLGIFPFTTTMSGEKTTCQTTFTFADKPCKGYEIHQGVTIDTTTGLAPSKVVMHDHSLGTYIHGILDNAPVIDWLLAPFTNRQVETEDYDTFKQRQYDLLADHVRAHLNMPLLYEALSVER